MKYSIAILALLFADSKLVLPTAADSVKERRISDLKDQVQRLLEANQLSDGRKKLPKQFEELLDTLASTMEKTGEMDLTNGEVVRSLEGVSEEMSMAMVDADTDTDVSPFGFSEQDFTVVLAKLLALLADLIKDIGSSSSSSGKSGKSGPKPATTQPTSQPTSAPTRKPTCVIA